MEAPNRKETSSPEDAAAAASSAEEAKLDLRPGAGDAADALGVEQLAADEEPASRWLRARWFVERYTLAHLTAYPVGVLASMAAIPLALMLRGEQVKQAGATGARWDLLAEVAADLKLDPTAAAQMEIVMQFALSCALATLLVPHITALPWAWAASRRRTTSTPQASDPTLARRFRWYLGSMLALAAFWLLVGAGGWIWLFTL